MSYQNHSIGNVLSIIFGLTLLLGLSACEPEATKPAPVTNTQNTDTESQSETNTESDTETQSETSTLTNSETNTQTNTVIEIDSDLDGILDSKDLCPNTQAGALVTNQGCSQTQIDDLNSLKDDDQDGVINLNDTCAATTLGQTVDINGCSDTQNSAKETDADLDGINDIDDLCANTSANSNVDNNGCAQYQLDTDQDSINNDKDQCANTDANLPVDLNGCALNQIDSDLDGINDDLDQCPNTVQTQTSNAEGCSQEQIEQGQMQLDDDKDNVLNDVDRCPMTPQDALVDQFGCAQSQLDSDQDGITNDLDICPNTPLTNVANNQGCAQTQLDDDNDGVNNFLDQCPNTPADSNVNAQGCVIADNDDSDFDGISNDLDQCPDTLPSEEIDNVGCAQNQLDTDKDGVNNQDDFCGSTYLGSTVDAKGCSDIELGKSEYENFGCVTCHGANGQGGNSKQIQTCSITDCTNQAQLTTYLINNMPRGGFGDPEDCPQVCSDLIAKYMIDTFVTFTNDNDKDGMNNANDQCDDTPAWLRDQIDNNGCTPQIELPVEPPVDTGSSKYINVGGEAVVSNINESFIADAYFTGGTTYTSMATIENTQDQELFNTERYGAFTYEIPMPNGQYEVALYFAETYHEAAGLRVFDLSLEGTNVLTNFDIYNDAGQKNKAVYKKFQVEITDGGLSIQTFKKTDNPKVSAIKIYPNEAPAPVETSLPIQTVGIGPYASCAVNQNDQTVCWGGNFMIGNSDGKNCKENPDLWGQGNCLSRAVPPTDLGEVNALSGTHTSACAILPNKNVRCWGPAGRIPQYPDVSNVIQLSNGDRQTCALSENGTVKCWKVDGNLDDADAAAHNVPNGLVAKAISSGARMSCAIRSNDNSVVCFSFDASIVKNPPANLKAKQIEVGGWNGSASPVHACAIDLDDNVVCWGDGAGVNVPNGLKAKSISAAEKFSCAVKLDGSAQCWGNHTNNFSNSTNNLAIFSQRDAGAIIKNDGTLVMFKQHGSTDVAFPANLKVKIP